MATTTRTATTTAKPAATDFISVCRSGATAQAAADKAVTDAQAAAAKLNTDAAAAAAKTNSDAAAAAAKITADAKAAADKAVADAKTQADTLVKTATDNQAAIKTKLATCPKLPTSADLKVVPGSSGSFTMGADGTLSRPAGSNGIMYIQSVNPLPATKDAYVSFQMAGPKSAGYGLFVGFAESAQANLGMSNGKNTGFFMTMTYEANSGKYFGCGHTGQDGGGSFIAYTNPFNATGPPAGLSANLRQIKDDTSTFVLHFDGTNFNIYHNNRLVLTKGMTAPAATAKYYLVIMSDAGSAIPVTLKNFMFGNAPSAADIQKFAATLPQTGGRRRRTASRRTASRRAASRRNRRKTYRG
jgi:hypothetical protein